MATTTFTGPVKSGNILSTTGTTVGTNIKNVGDIVLSQSGTINYDDTSATSLSFTIPANSQIVGIEYHVETLFASSSTTTIAVGISTDADNYVAASNVTATATSVDCEPAAAGRWTDIGSSDQTVYGIAVTNSATAGVARVVVNYLQARDLS